MNAINPGLAAGAVLASLSLLAAHAAQATAPTLYSKPANESPVRGDPDDLLFLPGDGFAPTDRVVYQSIADTTQSLIHPATVPTSSTVASGVAQVVSTKAVPHSLTVRLPTIMKADQSYAVWVVNAGNEWSTGIKINDARPLWVTPDSAFVTAQLASLPRSLKVVGRNLQHAPGAQTQVKLVGPATYTLFAADDNNPSTAIERYVAKVSLPPNVQAGTYSVQVTRDGVSWVALSAQPLVVNPDPVAPVQFSVGAAAYGGCVADDNNDDTACLVKAIAAAKANGGGTVKFDAGHWIIGNYSATGVTGDGILLPVGVNLSGAGAGVTFVLRGTGWNLTVPTFTPQGKNIIQGFTFTDANVYQTSSVASSPAQIFRLGTHWWAYNWYNPTDPNYVGNVIFTHNTFDKPFRAIGTGGLPLDHIYITYNDFGGFAGGVHFVADGNNVNQRLHVEDSVIDFNTFEPGSYVDPSIGQGVIASGLAGGHRLDFSGNVSDGTATKYLNSPTDAKGWRAAHFWNTGGGSHEQVLISQNTASCTGDKTGDGEFITSDGGGLTLGLPKPQVASASTAVTVTIPGPLFTQLPGSNPPIALPGNYFVGYWVQILDGPGRGQIRKIVSYPVDASGTPVLPITFTISPAWDVIPQATSRIIVLTEYWQMYIVDNTVDQRQPLCTKANQQKPSGGMIQFWGGQVADSVIEGNTQYDTDGIRVGLGYTEPDTTLNYGSTAAPATAVEIRGNVVNGEYDYPSSCSWSGIGIWNGAGLTPGSSPPVLTSGLSISHNIVTQADGLHGGAISMSLGGAAGPTPGPWDLTDGVAIFNNQINNVTGPPPTLVTGPLPYATSPYESCSADTPPRKGIGINDSSIWNTVLAGNICNTVATNLFDNGVGTQRICSASTVNGCECPVAPVAYWRFDEGSGTATADASGGGNNGTLSGRPAWTSGKTGSALNFNAAASYLAIGNTAALNDLYTSGQGMTVTAWIKPVSAGGGGGGRIVDKNNNDVGWFLKMNGSGTSLQFTADQFGAVGTTPGAAAIRNSAANSVVLNQWQHVAVTWAGTTDASKIHIFVNGVVADDTAAPVNGSGIAESDGGTPITIGNRPTDKARNFDGSIDGVRIYNRMLTAAEIQSLVNGGS